MANALKKITTRARQLQKKHPNTAWKNLIKKAGAEYRSGSLGAVKKKSARQTGSSNRKRDSEIKAKRPGKRKSASGKTYYERRKNRSDKPGSLTGVSTASLLSALKGKLVQNLGKQLLSREMATTKRDKKAFGKKITEIKRDIRKLK